MDLKTSAGRMIVAMALWERFCRDMNKDPGAAKVKLLAGIQMAIRDGIDKGRTEIGH